MTLPLFAEAQMRTDLPSPIAQIGRHQHQCRNCLISTHAKTPARPDPLWTRRTAVLGFELQFGDDLSLLLDGELGKRLDGVCHLIGLGEEGSQWHAEGVGQALGSSQITLVDAVLVAIDPRAGHLSGYPGCHA